MTEDDRKALVTKFYTAFSSRDHETMASCYHADAHFADPVFPSLDGWRIGAMWRMLCERGKDLELEFTDVKAIGDGASAHWDATYTFSGTGRKVLNRIDATFEFRDGLIVKHTDVFDLWAWTRMALGPSGWFLGWSGMVQGKVRGQASKNLDDFIDKRGIAPST